MPVPAWELALALVVVAGAAAVQSSVGVGFAVVSVPLLALLDPVLAPVPTLLLSLPLAAAMAWRERHAIDTSGIGWILVGRIPGAVIGLILLKFASQQVLDVLIAVVVLAAVAALAGRTTVARTSRTELVAGVASGTTGVVAAMGGPPLALLYRNERGQTIRASIAAVFTIGILLSITTRVAGSEIRATDFEAALWLAPAAVAGYLAGGLVADRFEGRVMRRSILAMSALAALALLVTSAL